MDKYIKPIALERFFRFCKYSELYFKSFWFIKKKIFVHNRLVTQQGFQILNFFFFLSLFLSLSLSFTFIESEYKSKFFVGWVGGKKIPSKYYTQISKIPSIIFFRIDLNLLSFSLLPLLPPISPPSLFSFGEVEFPFERLHTKIPGSCVRLKISVQNHYIPKSIIKYLREENYEYI